jgi:CheY-like chemotaxis protein
MDGLQCTSQIREWEKQGLLRSHVPIIAVTANARSEQITTLLEAGMVRLNVPCSAVLQLTRNRMTWSPNLSAFWNSSQRSKSLRPLTPRNSSQISLSLTKAFRPHPIPPTLRNPHRIACWLVGWFFSYCFSAVCIIEKFRGLHA